MPFSSTASSSVPWVRPLGEGAILLRFGTQISDDVNGKVLEYMNSLEKTMHGVDGVKEILPAFASLLVHFDPLKISANEVEEWCLGVTVQDHATRAREPRTVSIPVCYGGKHGADIEDAARMSGRSVDEVVKLHSEASYQVYFLGFTGGFPYLGGFRRNWQAFLAWPPRGNASKREPSASLQGRPGSILSRPREGGTCSGEPRSRSSTRRWTRPRCSSRGTP